MNARNWQTLTKDPDLKLVVADMDGTLLDEHSELPQGFWQLIDDMNARGIRFVPASGRQYQTLRAMFAERGGAMSYIAENGNVVVADDKIVGVHGVDWDMTRQVIDMVDAAVAAHAFDIGLVLCGLNTAYIQRTDKPFVDECSKYYHALKIVPDLHDVLGDPNETMLKLAIFDFNDAEAMNESLLSEVSDAYERVVSGAHWVDIMNPTVNKGEGVVTLQHALGVTYDQTAVFGDYLNDIDMLAKGKYSFAMENAHVAVKDAANFIAPANTEAGVLQVVRRLMGIDDAAI